MKNHLITVATLVTVVAATSAGAETIPNSGKPPIPNALPSPLSIFTDILLDPVEIGPQDHIPEFPATFPDPGPIPIPFPDSSGWPLGTGTGSPGSGGSIILYDPNPAMPEVSKEPL